MYISFILSFLFQNIQRRKSNWGHEVFRFNSWFGSNSLTINNSLNAALVWKTEATGSGGERCKLYSEPRHARHMPSPEDSVIAILTHVNKQLTKWLIHETQARPHLQTAAPDGLRALEPHFLLFSYSWWGTSCAGKKKNIYFFARHLFWAMSLQRCLRTTGVEIQWRIYSCSYADTVVCVYQHPPTHHTL